MSDSGTAQIILAVIGTGVSLLGIQVGLLLFLFRIQRQGLATLRLDIKETNARIDALDNRIDAMDKRLNARIDAMEDRLNARIDAMDNRIDAMEGRLNARIDVLYQTLFIHKDPAA